MDTEQEPQENVDEIKEQLKAAQEELTKFKDKDLNFANLRKQKEEAEEKVKALDAEVQTKIDAVRREVKEESLKDYYTEQLKELAGDDEELIKKITLQYGRIKDTAETKEDISKKRRDSWTLATADEKKEAPVSAFSSGGVSGIKPKNKVAFSQEEKELTYKLAKAGGIQLNDEDFS